MEEAIFFSSNILSKIAFDAATSSLTDSDDNFVAALFSAAWLEASVNELIFDLIQTDDASLDSKFLSAKRLVIATRLFESTTASIELKLNVLCAATTDQQLDWGAQPWQRTSLLFQLRNWILHLRPERMKVRPGTEDEASSVVSREVHKLVTALKNAGAISHIPEGQLVPVAIAASLPGVGRWTYRVAYDSLKAVASWRQPWERKLLLSAREPI